MTLEIMYKNKVYSPESFAIDFNFPDLEEAEEFMCSLIATGRAYRVTSKPIYANNSSESTITKTNKSNEDDIWETDDIKEYYGYDRNDSDDVL